MAHPAGQPLSPLSAVEGSEPVQSLPSAVEQKARRPVWLAKLLSYRSISVLDQQTGRRERRRRAAGPSPNTNDVVRNGNARDSSVRNGGADDEGETIDAVLGAWEMQDWLTVGSSAVPGNAECVTTNEGGLLAAENTIPVSAGRCLRGEQLGANGDAALATAPSTAGNLEEDGDFVDRPNATAFVSAEFASSAPQPASIAWFSLNGLLNYSLPFGLSRNNDTSQQQDADADNRESARGTSGDNVHRSAVPRSKLAAGASHPQQPHDPLAAAQLDASCTSAEAAFAAPVSTGIHIQLPHPPEAASTGTVCHGENVMSAQTGVSDAGAHGESHTRRTGERSVRPTTAIVPVISSCEVEEDAATHISIADTSGSIDAIKRSLHRSTATSVRCPSSHPSRSGFSGKQAKAPSSAAHLRPLWSSPSHRTSIEWEYEMLEEEFAESQAALGKHCTGSSAKHPKAANVDGGGAASHADQEETDTGSKNLFDDDSSGIASTSTVLLVTPSLLNPSHMLTRIADRCGNRVPAHREASNTAAPGSQANTCPTAAPAILEQTSFPSNRYSEDQLPSPNHSSNAATGGQVSRNAANRDLMSSGSPGNSTAQPSVDAAMFGISLLDSWAAATATTTATNGTPLDASLQYMSLRDPAISASGTHANESKGSYRTRPDSLAGDSLTAPGAISTVAATAVVSPLVAAAAPLASVEESGSVLPDLPSTTATRSTTSYRADPLPPWSRSVTRAVRTHATQRGWALSSSTKETNFPPAVGKKEPLSARALVEREAAPETTRNPKTLNPVMGQDLLSPCKPTSAPQEGARQQGPSRKSRPPSSNEVMSPVPSDARTDGQHPPLLPDSPAPDEAVLPAIGTHDWLAMALSYDYHTRRSCPLSDRGLAQTNHNSPTAVERQERRMVTPPEGTHGKRPTGTDGLPSFSEAGSGGTSASGFQGAHQGSSLKDPSLPLSARPPSCPPRYVTKTHTTTAGTLEMLVLPNVEGVYRALMEESEKREWNRITSFVDMYQLQHSQKQHLAHLWVELKGASMDRQPAPLRNLWAQVEGEKEIFLRRANDTRLLMYLDHLATTSLLRLSDDYSRYMDTVHAQLAACYTRPTPHVTEPSVTGAATAMERSASARGRCTPQCRALVGTPTGSPTDVDTGAPHHIFGLPSNRKGLVCETHSGDVASSPRNASFNNSASLSRSRTSPNTQGPRGLRAVDDVAPMMTFHRPSVTGRPRGGGCVVGEWPSTGSLASGSQAHEDSPTAFPVQCPEEKDYVSVNNVELSCHTDVGKPVLHTDTVAMPCSPAPVSQCAELVSDASSRGEDTSSPNVIRANGPSGPLSEERYLSPESQPPTGNATSSPHAKQLTVPAPPQRHREGSGCCCGNHANVFNADLCTLFSPSTGRRFRPAPMVSSLMSSRRNPEGSLTSDKSLPTGKLDPSRCRVCESTASMTATMPPLQQSSDLSFPSTGDQRSHETLQPAHHAQQHTLAGASVHPRTDAPFDRSPMSPLGYVTHPHTARLWPLHAPQTPTGESSSHPSAVAGGHTERKLSSGSNGPSASPDSVTPVASLMPQSASTLSSSLSRHEPSSAADTAAASHIRRSSAPRLWDPLKSPSYPLSTYTSTGSATASSVPRQGLPSSYPLARGAVRPPSETDPSCASYDRVLGRGVPGTSVEPSNVSLEGSTAAPSTQLLPRDAPAEQDQTRFWGCRERIRRADFSEALHIMGTLVQSCLGLVFDHLPPSHCSSSRAHNHIMLYPTVAFGVESTRTPVRHIYGNGDTYVGFVEMREDANVGSTAVPRADGRRTSAGGCTTQAHEEGQRCYREGCGLYNFAESGVAFFGWWHHDRPCGDGILLLVGEAATSTTTALPETALPAALTLHAVGDGDGAEGGTWATGTSSQDKRDEERMPDVTGSRCRGPVLDSVLLRRTTQLPFAATAAAGAGDYVSPRSSTQVFPAHPLPHGAPKGHTGRCLSHRSSFPPATEAMAPSLAGSGTAIEDLRDTRNPACKRRETVPYWRERPCSPPPPMLLVLGEWDEGVVTSVETVLANK